MQDYPQDTKPSVFKASPVPDHQAVPEIAHVPYAGFTVPQPAIPEPEAAPEGPLQVDAAVFLAARLRESISEGANLRQLVADLQTELARLKAKLDQTEIERLDAAYNVGSGTILQARPDGTYWRIPKSALRQG